jgi:Uma2 family endonuclease
MDEETILDPPVTVSHAAFEAMFPDLTKLPTDLPDEDLVPMESQWHYHELNLLVEVAACLWRDRQDVFIGANMFVYFSIDQANSVKAEVAQEFETGLVLPPEKRTFRGPDFFVIRHVDATHLRKSWKVWEEHGRYPDLIIELLSDATANVDRTTKKDLYEKTFRALEYFCYDPGEQELTGWRLSGMRYEPIEAGPESRLWSVILNAWLGKWEGEYTRYRDIWLRLYDIENQLVPTLAELERERADKAERRADALEAEVARLRAQLGDAGSESAQE